MKSWEKALNTFVEGWKDKKEVEGIIVTGSFVAGTDNKNSDIDVHIILSDSTKWRERGNKKIDGFLIEYFANPAKTVEQYFQNDNKRQKRITARMLAIGKIVLDKKGVVAKLQQKAQKELKRPLPKKDKVWQETAKYLLWDSLDGLLDLCEADSPGFHYHYRIHLNKLLETYSIFKGTEFIASTKIYRYLTDPSFAKKYQMTPFPDKVFGKQFVACLTASNTEDKMNAIKKLTQHVFDKMGGFKIDGWKLRSSALDKK